MGKSSQYNHYMRSVSLDGTPLDSWKNIEDKFTGLRYLSAKGIFDIGKPKNIYTETYAESDRMRVYLPKHNSGGSQVHSVSDIANEQTEISMTFLVIGSSTDRIRTIIEFENYVREGAHSYYDDARNLEFDFIVTGELKVSEEKWHGDVPYIELTVPMQNLNGKTRIHS